LRQIYLLGLFLLASGVAFSLNLNSYFLSDDFVQIGKVLHGDLSVAWGQEYGGFFRPLFIASYLIDSRLWGASPLGFHLTNAFLHALNAFLLFRLALRMFEPIMPDPRMRTVIAISAAALFLLHPSHAEAVVWISGRADLIATCFVLLSLLLYLAFEDQLRPVYIFASAGCFVLALLAKESAVCLPFLILIAGIYRSPRKTMAHLFGVVAGYMAILFVFILIRAWYIGTIVGGYGTAQHLNFSLGWIRDRLLEAIVRSVLPPLPSSWLAFLFKPLQSPAFYLIMLLVAAVVGVFTVTRRRHYSVGERRGQNRFLLLLAGMFLCALLPVINLRLSLYETLGERFLYLPTVFACLFIAYVAMVLTRTKRPMVLLVLIIISLYSWSLYRTGLVWREAANLSHTISRELADSASENTIVMLNAPDNLRGVPVFHNGLREAIAWPSNAMSQVQIVAFQDLQRSGDETVISGSRPLYIRVVNSADTFTRVSGSDCLEVSNSGRNTLLLDLKPCASGSEIFFLSAGRINRLQSP
jgi:hypothetical protein